MDTSQNNEHPNPQNEGNTNSKTEDKPTIGLSILSFIIPLVGFILAFVNWKTKPISAKRYLIISSVAVSIFLFLDAVSSCNSSSTTNNSTVKRSKRARCEYLCNDKYNQYSDSWNSCMYACKDYRDD